MIYLHKFGNNIILFKFVKYFIYSPHHLSVHIMFYLVFCIDPTLKHFPSECSCRVCGPFAKFVKFYHTTFVRRTFQENVVDSHCAHF